MELKRGRTCRGEENVQAFEMEGNRDSEKKGLLFGATARVRVSENVPWQGLVSKTGAAKRSVQVQHGPQAGGTTILILRVKTAKGGGGLRCEL